MAAVVLTGHGGFERLTYRTDVPVPKPGPNDVLVEVHACALNQTDVNTRLGWYGNGVLSTDDTSDEAPGTWSGVPLEFPLIQGSAMMGRIVAAGSAVTATRHGERVVVDPVVRPGEGSEADPTFIGSEHNGGYAHYIAVPSDCALPVGDEVDDVSLAAAQVSHTTASEMLLRGRLTAGETIVVTGATGGVGTALVQLASLRGARVVTLTTSGRSGRLRALGADTVIEWSTAEQLPGQLTAAGVRRVDMVADVVGGAMFEPLLRELRIGGRHVTGGAIAGAKVGLDLRELIYRDVEVIGVGSLASDRSVRAVLDELRSGALRPVVAATYPLERLVDAQRTFLAREELGRVVVTTSALEC